jgi:hypothetical protein
MSLVIPALIMQNQSEALPYKASSVTCVDNLCVTVEEDGQNGLKVTLFCKDFEQ